MPSLACCLTLLFAAGLFAPGGAGALDGAVELSGRTDGVVEARLRGNAAAVRSVYAGRWRADSRGSHRVGLSAPPAVVGPVTEGGVLAHLSRPGELVADPKGHLWSSPLSLVPEPSPATDFGVLVRAGVAVAVLKGTDRTTATVLLGPTPRSWKRIGLVGSVGASWPTPGPPPEEWFPEALPSHESELYHAGGGLFFSPVLRDGSVAAVAVANVSAAHTLRPGTAASLHVLGEGNAATLRLAGARVGRHYTAPDGSEPARTGPVVGPSSGARYRGEGRFTLERRARLLLDGAVSLQEVPEGPRWIDRSVELEWRISGDRGPAPGTFEIGVRAKETSDGEGELRPAVELSGRTAAGRLEPAMRSSVTFGYEAGRDGADLAAADPVAAAGGGGRVVRRLDSAELLFRGQVVVRPAAGAMPGTLAIPIATEIGWDFPVAAAPAHEDDAKRGSPLTTLSMSLGGEWEGRVSKLKGMIRLESRGRPSPPEPGKFWEAYRLSLEIALRWSADPA